MTTPPPPEAELHDAFARHDAAAVDRLLNEFPAFRDRINQPVFPYDAPAIVACANDAAMVKVLLAHGADPNQRSNWWAGGFHALHSATGAAADLLLAAGAEPDACALAHLDRIDLLERMLADHPERVHERGGDGQTPLHFARSRAAIDLLLGAGADIDARDVDHRATAAEWMLDRRKNAGRYDLATYLVERGATADIFLAAALGLAGSVRALLTADPTLLDARTGQGHYAEQPPSSFHIYFWTIGGNRSALDTALQFGHAELLDIMMEFATPRQRFLLVCRRGDGAAAKTMLRDHPDLIASLTPDDHRALADAAWQADAKAVALMLELGFDPMVPGHDGGTALHCAAWQGSPETVALLLAHPAASQLFGVRDARYDATPLGWCCHGSLHSGNRENHSGVATLLIAAGSPIEPDLEGSPAVMAVLGR
ncbi:MAG: hypothetical protein ABI542_09055 [Gemmatimonadota bacterium]